MRPDCPFCGSQRLVARHDKERWFVLCDSCGAQGPDCPTQEGAVRRWARDPAAWAYGTQGHLHCHALGGPVTSAEKEDAVAETRGVSVKEAIRLAAQADQPSQTEVPHA